MKEKRPILLPILLATVSTFIAVFAGVRLADSRSQSGKRIQVASLLETAREDLGAIGMQTAGSRIRGDAKFNASHPWFSHANPCPYPVLLGDLLRSGFVLEHISPESYRVLAGSMQNMTRTIQFINQSGASRSSGFRKHVDAYLTELAFARRILSLEQEFMLDRIRQDDFHDIMDKIGDRKRLSLRAL